MGTRGFTTRILHSDRSKPIEHGALHKPIHTSIPYGYADSRELARVFQGEQAGFTYARQGQPTAAALEDKITGMEEGVATVAFGTGMGAIASTVLALLRSGDHLVSSSYLFGNTNSLFNTFERMGVRVSYGACTTGPAMRTFMTATRKGPHSRGESCRFARRGCATWAPRSRPKQRITSQSARRPSHCGWTAPARTP